MNIFEIWSLGYLSIAFAKFVLLLPSTVEHAKFIFSIKEVQPNTWLMLVLTPLAYVITSLLWPPVLYEERFSFFTYKPFDESAKQKILEKINISKDES